MSDTLAKLISGMMDRPLKPAGAGVTDAFDRTLMPPPLSSDESNVNTVEGHEDWGWIDTIHVDFWHRIYVFMADRTDADKGLAAITMTHFFVEPKGFEGIFDINNQLAVAIVVAKNRVELSRRAQGQEFCEPSEIIQQMKTKGSAASVLIDAVQNKNFLSQIDNACRYRGKRQSAAYVLEQYRNDFKLMSMMGYKERPVKGGFLWERDVAEVH